MMRLGEGSLVPLDTETHLVTLAMVGIMITTFTMGEFCINQIKDTLINLVMTRYHIYTAAVMAKANDSWGAEWGDKVLHMISDVAEPSRVSPWYPFTRVKDWYDGHSWASGIFLFGDAKNQESTSEAVMGWYAIYLWGLATSNKRLGDLGRLMTALEVAFLYLCIMHHFSKHLQGLTPPSPKECSFNAPLMLL